MDGRCQPVCCNDAAGLGRVPALDQTPQRWPHRRSVHPGPPNHVSLSRTVQNYEITSWLNIVMLKILMIVIFYEIRAYYERSIVDHRPLDGSTRNQSGVNEGVPFF